MKIVLQSANNGREKILTEVETAIQIEDGIEVMKPSSKCTIYENAVISEVSGCDLLLYVDHSGQKHTKQASAAVQSDSGKIVLEQGGGVKEDEIDGWICGATHTGPRGHDARFEKAVRNQ